MPDKEAFSLEIERPLAGVETLGSEQVRYCHTLDVVVNKLLQLNIEIRKIRYSPYV